MTEALFSNIDESCEVNPYLHLVPMFVMQVI